MALPRKQLCGTRWKRQNLAFYSRAKHFSVTKISRLQQSSFSSFEYITELLQAGSIRRNMSNIVTLCTERRGKKSDPVDTRCRNTQCSLPSHPRSPLPHSPNNMWSLQAWWERGVSAQENWVRENEVGDEPISTEEGWSTFVENTHTRARLSLFLMGMLRQIYTHLLQSPAPARSTISMPRLCYRRGGLRPCQGRKVLQQRWKKQSV